MVNQDKGWYGHAMLRKLQIWRDRRGRVSILRLATLALLLMPLAKALWDADAIIHGARPINDLIHRAGFWMLMFLLTALAITPMRRITRFGDLIDVRRMIGVGAFLCGVVHISLYTADQMFDLVKVASEIAQRVYLTIGFTALIGLLALACTSTDAMVRNLGAMRWTRLHQAVYLIGGLALIHFFQQTKADVSVPTFTAGVFAWLMGYRIVLKLREARGEPSTLVLVGLAVAAAATTMAAEAVGIAMVFNVSPLTVLGLNFDFDIDIDMLRPGWLVLAAGLAVATLNAVCAWARPSRRARAAPDKRATSPMAVRERSAA
jgi:sulfoxide reductase heme-binding subunit YedZ